MRLAAGFEQQHLVAAVLGQPIGKRGAGRPCTDDDVIGRADVHVRPFTFLSACEEDIASDAHTTSAQRASRARFPLSRLRDCCKRLCALTRWESGNIIESERAMSGPGFGDLAAERLRRETDLDRISEL